MPERPKNLAPIEPRKPQTAAEKILAPNVSDNRTVRAAVRITADIDQKLKRISLKTARSVSATINLAISEYIMNHPELL